MAQQKAHCRLPISDNWTFFRYLSQLRNYQAKSVNMRVFTRTALAIRGY